VDGSGGKGLSPSEQEGFNVSVVQNPTLTLHDDAAATRRVLDQQDGPTILVGQLYRSRNTKASCQARQIGRLRPDLGEPPISTDR